MNELKKGDKVTHKTDGGPDMIVVGVGGRDLQLDAGYVNCEWYCQSLSNFTSGTFLVEALTLADEYE